MTAAAPPSVALAALGRVAAAAAAAAGACWRARVFVAAYAAASAEGPN